MQDAGVYHIVSSPETYAAYLNVQGNNPMYSAGNIALAMIQNPNVTQIGTIDRWRTLGRTVRDIEKNNGIQIFARGSFGKGYSISNAYDISQTVGRDIPTVQIGETSKEMETALTTVMNYSQVSIVPDETLPVPAYYDSNKLELAVNPQCTFAETFPVLAAEVVIFSSDERTLLHKSTMTERTASWMRKAFHICCASDLASKATCPMYHG